MRRLRPKLAVVAADNAHMRLLRDKLARRIDERARGTYERGYRDGQLQARAGLGAGADTDADADEPQTYPRLRLPG